MSNLYFAYGSNLKAIRMRERVPSAQPHGLAWLENMRVVFDKLGRDGSGKANLGSDAGGRTWGFVYRIDADDWPLLDGFEPGYSRVRVEVVGTRDAPLSVQTYLADEPVAGLTAYLWYRTLLVEGAREHALPEDYVQQLLTLPIRAT